MASLDAALVGRVIGEKFRLSSCIGVGASGAVYQADQLTLGRTVAIKILRRELATDARLVRRFHDEAMASSRLNHPNTVSVIDYGQTEDGLLYIVMEYLRGRTLTQVLRSDSLDARRIAQIGSQILSGLEEAHHGGIVHADLKSDNIVVEHRRGGWDLVKLVDFGISRLLGRPDEEETDRTICGTPEYMAPEVIGGAEPTFASDIYSVGVILFELLVGETPFAGGDTVSVLMRHIDEAPRPPSELRPGAAIPPELEAAVLKALAKSPDDRFVGAAEFREALDAVANVSSPRGEEVLCVGCGVNSSATFKFCPECGESLPTLAEGTGRNHLRSEPEEVVDPLPASIAPGERVTRATREFAFSADRTAGGIFPFPQVGRDAELAALVEFVAAGSGATGLQLVGSRGSGKSRLLREAFAVIPREGLVIFVATADPSGLARTLYPVRAIVAGVLGLPPICTFEDLASAVLGLGLGERDIPGIAELFGYQTDIAQLEPSVRRREMLASSNRVLRAAAQDRQTILAFEDVDRYDQPSQAVIRQLAEQSQEHRLRLLCTSTPELAPPWLAAMSRIDLEPLGEPALLALAAHLARGNRDMPDGEALAAVTGGLPGHAHQLARYVIEGGSTAGAPIGLANLVEARVDLLPREARLACQAAAVFGGEVARGTLRSATAERLDRGQMDEALSVLVARGIVIEDHGLIRFDEQLVREVAYESTPADVRRELHRAAITALEETSRDPGVLGHHLELSGALDAACEALARAGDAAIEQLDDHGACALYNRALACARRVMLGGDDGDDRMSFVTTSVKLADTLRAIGNISLARGVIEEARNYAGGTPSLRAHLDRATAHVLSATGEPEGAIDSLHDAIGLAIASGQRDLLVDLYLDLSAMCLRAGRQAQAAGELAEGIDLVTAGDGASASGGPEHLWRLVLKLGQLRAADGQRAGAVELGHHALEHAERVRSRAGAARAHAFLAAEYEESGDSGRAEDHRRRAVEEMRLLGDRRGTAELLLAGTRLSSTVARIQPSRVAEARLLAEEVGWSEGVRRAESASEGGTE